jgi:hypothetical protein
MKVAGTLRSLPAGAPVTGVTVEVRKEIAPNDLVGSAVTDANGRWELTVNGNPGPYYWEATDTSPAGADVVRKGSSKSYGSGGTYSLYELPIALRTRGNGVVPGYLDGMAVTHPGGLNLDVTTGAVLAHGIPVVWHTPVTYAVAETRDATHPKACYLVVLVVGPGEEQEGLSDIGVICGTAAASPALPDITAYQTAAAWNVPLASFILPNASGSALTSVVDLESNPAASNPIASSIVRRTNPATTHTTTNTGATGEDATDLTTSLTLLAGVTYDLAGRVWLASSIDNAAYEAQVAVYLETTAYLSEFVGHSSTSPLGVSNVHAREGVAGTGAAVSCGVRVRVTGGTMGYTVGYFQAIARPRW